MGSTSSATVSSTCSHSLFCPVLLPFPPLFHVGLVNQGPQTGPLTPAFGDLVQTPRGLASIALEGFSEDLNEDGYVDPVAQATVPVAQPVAVAHSPQLTLLLLLHQ